jgi:hypothetical protein
MPPRGHETKPMDPPTATGGEDAILLEEEGFYGI